MVVVRRAFIVTFFQRERCAQLHSSVCKVIDEIEVKTRKIVIGTRSRTVVRAVDSIFRVSVCQEPTTVPPFFDKIVVTDSRGIRVRAYIDCDESIGHHIA
jgi:hypothetical protein